MSIDSAIIITGRNVIDPQKTIISEYNPQLQLVDQQKSDNIITPACRKCLAYKRKLWSVSGYGPLLNLHQQQNTFFGMQYGEAYSFSNNYMGRLSWNQSYRLRSIHKLYLATGISSLKELYNDSVTELLNRANKSTSKFFYSKKYGLDKQKQISFLVDNAVIYYSMLEGVEILNDQNEQRVIEYAEIMFDSSEKDWTRDHYRFPYGESVTYDGVPLPFNQQNAMGLLSIELYKNTKNNKYLERTAKLLQYFSNHMTDHNGVRIWHYWPQFFYNGWQAHQQVSYNTSVRSPHMDTLFEDYSHAAINLEFLINASLLLGEKMTVQPEEILANSLFASGFSRFISGDTTYQAADWTFTPSFPWTLFDPVKSLYLRKINQNPDYDNQDFSNGVLAIDSQGHTAIKISSFDSGETLFQCSENSNKCKSDLFLFFYANRHVNE